MKLILEINNKAGNKINRELLTKTAEKTLKSAGSFLAKKNISSSAPESFIFCFSKKFEDSGAENREREISISLAIVSEEEIKKLNKTYRHKNMPTDTLSFAEYKNQKELMAAGDKNLFLGEVILCYNNIKKYSEKNSLNFNKELAKTFSHSLLHLLGFRHGKKMFAIQEKA